MKNNLKLGINGGRTLIDLCRLDEAESLLDKAKAGIALDPYPSRASAAALAEGYIELYTRFHKTRPELGFDAKAKHWQKKRELLKWPPTYFKEKSM